MGDSQAFALHLEENGDTQLQRVFDLMASGRWWTLATLSQRARGSPAAVSARIRDIRAGGATILKRYAGGGVWLYRMVAA